MPVLAPKLQAFVPKGVRETSLDSMVGVPHDEDEGEQVRIKLLQQEDNDGASDSPHTADPPPADTIARAAARRKNRKLYKQLSGTEVPWFPHDNAIDLLKELVWEAGRPRWVFHGTPAGGAGVHGCLEAGCSVVAVCFNEHHRTHLTTFLSERAVEAMVSGTTMVFKDEALQARSVQLNLTPTPKAASAKTPEEKDAAGEHDPKDKKDKKAKEKKDEKEEKDKKSTKGKNVRPPNRLPPPTAMQTATPTAIQKVRSLAPPRSTNK